MPNIPCRRPFFRCPDGVFRRRENPEHGFAAGGFRMRRVRVVAGGVFPGRVFGAAAGAGWRNRSPAFAKRERDVGRSGCLSAEFLSRLFGIARRCRQFAVAPAADCGVPAVLASRRWSECASSPYGASRRAISGTSGPRAPPWTRPWRRPPCVRRRRHGFGHDRGTCRFVGPGARPFRRRGHPEHRPRSGFRSAPARPAIPDAGIAGPQANTAAFGKTAGRCKTFSR